MYGIVGCGYELKNAFNICAANDIQIDYLFDNYFTGVVNGYSVYPLCEVRNYTNIKLVVSTTKYYLEIKKQLESYRLIEYKDFFPAGSIGKKKVFIYEL